MPTRSRKVAKDNKDNCSQGPEKRITPPQHSFLTLLKTRKWEVRWLSLQHSQNHNHALSLNTMHIVYRPVNINLIMIIAENLEPK